MACQAVCASDTLRYIARARQRERRPVLHATLVGEGAHPCHRRGLSPEGVVFAQSIRHAVPKHGVPLSLLRGVAPAEGHADGNA
jgi:hypothetical protein